MIQSSALLKMYVMEVVYECPEEYTEECMERIKKYMAHPFGDNVELNLEMKADADVGDSYAEAK